MQNNLKRYLIFCYEKHIDELVEITGFNATMLISILVVLQTEGIVRRKSDKVYELAKKKKLKLRRQ